MNGEQRGEEGGIAETLAFALAGRPERVEDGMLVLGPPELREGLRAVRELLAALALSLSATSPAAELRERVVASVRAREKRRAIVVVDMIHDHLDPGALLEVPRARAVVPALRERLAKARAVGVPVVYVVDEHDPDDPDLDAWGTHAVKGTPGTEVWHEIRPEPGDLVVKKPSYSAFFETELEGTLAKLGVDTLVLTGCLTEIGLMATATDAMQRGFEVEVPPDAQAGSCPELEQAALGAMRLMAPFGPARRARLEARARAA